MNLVTFCLHEIIYETSGDTHNDDVYRKKETKKKPKHTRSRQQWSMCSACTQIDGKRDFFREEYVYMEAVSQAEKRLTHTHTRRSNWKRSTHIDFVRHNYMIDVINYFGVLFCKTEANVLKAPRERESLSSSIDSEIHIKNDFDTRKWEKSGFLALLIIGTDRCGVAIVIHYNANKQTK